MSKVFTNGNLAWQAFVNVKFSGVLKFAGTVKIRGFDTFSRFKSKEGGYHVSYGSTLKLSSRRLLYRVYKCHVKRYRVSH